MKFRGAACALFVLTAAACGTATSEEQQPTVYERPGIPIGHYETARQRAYDHRLGVFYERVYWSGAEALAGAEFAGAVDALAAEIDRQIRSVAEAVSPRSSGGGGSCGVPPDTGEPLPIPDYVIQRESGGRLDASNGSHFGRAQVSCQHYAQGGGCVGLSYAQCVTKLWNGGAGASNWEQTL